MGRDNHSFQDAAFSVLAEKGESFTIMAVTLIGPKGVDHKDGRAERSPKFLDKAQEKHDKTHTIQDCLGTRVPFPCDVNFRGQQARIRN